MDETIWEKYEVVEIFAYDNDIRGRHSKNPHGVLGLITNWDEKFLRVIIPSLEEYKTKDVTFNGPGYIVPWTDIERIMVYGYTDDEATLGYIDDYLKRKTGSSSAATVSPCDPSQVDPPDIVE